MSTYGSCYGARSGAFPPTRCSECRKQEPWTVAFLVLVFCSSLLSKFILQLFALLTLFKMGRNSVDDAVKAMVIHLWNFMSRPSTQLKSNLFSFLNNFHRCWFLVALGQRLIFLSCFVKDVAHGFFGYASKNKNSMPLGVDIAQ